MRRCYRGTFASLGFFLIAKMPTSGPDGEKKETVLRSQSNRIPTILERVFTINRENISTIYRIYIFIDSIFCMPWLTNKKSRRAG